MAPATCLGGSSGRYGFAVSMSCRYLFRYENLSMPVWQCLLIRFPARILAPAGFFAACLVLAAGVASAQSRPALADLSLEQLAQMKVISVSKSAKSVSSSAASIFVLTERDIHRSAVTTLPEALRLAPNLQVARIDARDYAITARGFNNRLSNKLLVLVDGRSVYSPLFSGVFWDTQDVMLEDLDRIEVVSGPGGTLWGANAVNGVVNIVTQSAAHTQGTLVSLGAGANERQLAARYGGELADDGYYRVYAKHARHDDTRHADGSSSFSGWQRSQTGFRSDWEDDSGALTLQGDAYTGELREARTGDKEITGANLMATVSRVVSPHSQISVKAYVDHTERDEPLRFQQYLTVFDLELQQGWSAGQRHNFVWGGGYRHVIDRINNAGAFAILPERQTVHWQNVFLQDEIRLFDNIRLTLGGKLEYNPYTQWEALPSAQVAWAPEAHKLLWGSLSRAVRSPARFDRDFYVPAVPEVIDGVPQYNHAGGADFRSEVANVVEVGYRGQYSAKVSYSVTAFHSHYERLRTLEPNPAGSGTVFANRATADAYGIEMWSSWQGSDNWRMHAGLVLQEFDFDLDPGSRDQSSETSLVVGDPEHYWQLRSSYDVSDNLRFDATVRQVAELRLESARVPAYTELDASIAWRIKPHMELSLVGKNLLGDVHIEYGHPAQASQFDRSVYGKLVWGL